MPWRVVWLRVAESFFGDNEGPRPQQQQRSHPSHPFPRLCLSLYPPTLPLYSIHSLEIWLERKLAVHDPSEEEPMHPVFLRLPNASHLHPNDGVGCDLVSILPCACVIALCVKQCNHAVYIPACPKSHTQRVLFHLAFLQPLQDNGRSRKSDNTKTVRTCCSVDYPLPD